MSGREHVDYLMIGSGVAASSVAMRLLDSGASSSILMLEAGDRIPAKDRRAWWDYVVTRRLPYDYTYDKPGANPSTGNTEWQMRGTRVTAYGGTTMHWGGWSLRLQPEDFELYSRTGQGGDWPLGYDELEEYYCQAEEHLSVCGDKDDNTPWRSKPFPLPPYPWLEPDIEIAQAFEEHGVRPGRMPLARYRKCMTTGTCRYCPLGARFSAQYVNEALEQRYPDKLEIRTQATVTRIVLDDSGKRVCGVEYLDRNTGATRRVDAETVILCAGAFESPKLLMCSTGPGHPNGIGNNTELVGKYLVSHSFLSVSGTATKNQSRMTSEFGFPTLMSRSYDDETRQATGKIFMFRNQNLPGPRYGWDGLMQEGLTRPEIDAAATGPRQTGLSAFYEEFGQDTNYLRPIPGKTDQFGLPLMEVHFSREREVMKNANLRLTEMAKIFASIPDYTVVSQQFQGAAGYHASGSCRMSASPKDGVTDRDLRVHGVDNLYVCSNAVFPSIGAVNPTLTLTALALRLADHLGAGDPGRSVAMQEASA